jgi:hypothetical protein
MRIATILAIVAAVAFAFGLKQTAKRQHIYTLKSRLNTRNAAVYARFADSLREKMRQAETDEQRAELSRRIARNAAWLDYSRSMKEKYERAASHPWWGVGPDPPPPVQ